MLYRVMNTTVDTINGLYLKVGQFVETDERKWVARMGDTLREEMVVPSNADVVKVQNTVESIVEEVGPADGSTYADEKSLAKSRVPNKAILGERVQDK